MTRTSPPHGMNEPKDCFLTETYVEFNQESMTEQRFPEDVDRDDTAHGEMLFNAYREQVYHSQREGLFFGQVSSSKSDRGNPLLKQWQKAMIERCNPLLKQWQKKATIGRCNPLLKQVKNKTLNMHRLGLFWTDRGSKSSPNVRRRLRNTNSRLIMTEEVHKN